MSSIRVLRQRIVWFCLMFFAALLMATAPQVAYAATNYTIDELSTELQVQTNGSVHVITRQVITFEGPNTGYTWYLHVPEVGESLKINSVRVAPVDDGGTLIGDWTRLQMVDVDKENQGENPGDGAIPILRHEGIQPWYSYSISDGMVRSYFPANDGSYMIEIDYDLSNRVLVYRDIAELYWRYVHGSLPVNSQDITLQITLPVPYDASFTPGEDVIAWGHGPHDGRLVINPDGSIVYQIDFLETGHYGEAHIIFPASWMTNMNPAAPHLYTEVHKKDVLVEEDEWVDSSTRGALWDNKVRLLFFAIAALVLLVGVIGVARFGLTARSRRFLIRIACTIAVIALIAQLFFREPLTVNALFGVALVVLLVALFLPKADKKIEELSDNGGDKDEMQGGEDANDGEK